LNRLKQCIYRINLFILRLYCGEKAQTLTEYGLLIILIAVAQTVFLFVFSGDIADLFRSAGPELQNIPQH